MPTNQISSQQLQPEVLLSLVTQLGSNFLPTQIILGQPGSTRALQAVVNTYTLFNKTINGTGNDVNGVAFNGIAYGANYMDVAEYYVSDRDYAPGTLIRFGGSKEITQTEPDMEVHGVVSEKPGLILGEPGEGKLKVALIGRVPVLFDGAECPPKGTKLYRSRSIPGKASTSITGIPFGVVVGEALDSKGRVECVVRLSF